MNDPEESWGVAPYRSLIGIGRTFATEEEMAQTLWASQAEVERLRKLTPSEAISDLKEELRLANRELQKLQTQMDYLRLVYTPCMCTADLNPTTVFEMCLRCKALADNVALRRTLEA